MTVSLKATLHVPSDHGMSKRSQPPKAESQDSKGPDVPEPDYKRVKVADVSHPLLSDPAMAAPQPDADTSMTAMLMMVENRSARATVDSSSALNLPGSITSPADAVASPAAKPRQKGKKDFTNKVDRRGKRARVGWRAPQQDLEGTEDNSEKKERLAKRKCVVLLGFCGTGYSGMQMLVQFESSWKLKSPTIRFVY